MPQFPEMEKYCNIALQIGGVLQCNFWRRSAVFLSRIVGVGVSLRTTHRHQQDQCDSMYDVVCLVAEGIASFNIRASVNVVQCDPGLSLQSRQVQAQSSWTVLRTDRFDRLCLSFKHHEPLSSSILDMMRQFA